VSAGLALPGRFALGLAIAALPALAAAQELVPPREPIEPPYLRLALALLLGLFIAVFAALALKRFMSGAIRLPTGGSPRSWLNLGGREVVVYETHRISLHGDVCRLGWAGRQYLVLIAAGGVTVLREIEDARAEKAP
jgi:hypothetical protein